MNRLDFTPYRRSTVGFDRLFDLMEKQARNSAGDNYPPFNIERRSDDEYRITIAVAGPNRRPRVDSGFVCFVFPSMMVVLVFIN